MKYAVVTEKTANDDSAHAPALSGGAAIGQPLAEMGSELESAIELHLKGPLEDNLVVPAATSIAEYTETIAA